MMNNVFYFISKAIFVLKIFTFCPDIFRYVGKGLDKKAKKNFKIYDVTSCNPNNYNKPWIYNTNRNNMEEYSFIKVS